MINKIYVDKITMNGYFSFIHDLNKIAEAIAQLEIEVVPNQKRENKIIVRRGRYIGILNLRKVKSYFMFFDFASDIKIETIKKSIDGNSNEQIITQDAIDLYNQSFANLAAFKDDVLLIEGDRRNNISVN